MENISQNPEGSAEVIEVLEMMKKVNTQLVVTLPFHEETYVSQILEVQGNSFLIDTLIPKDGNEYMDPGEKIRFSIIIQGTSYDFLAICQGKTKHSDGFPCFRLSFPDKINVSQRRRFFRVKPFTELTISFTNPFSMVQSVSDLSLAGLSFEYRPVEGNKLEVGARLGNVMVQLKENLTILPRCEVVSHHISELGTLNKPLSYTCGVQFLNLSEEHRRQLAQYITEAQLVERRREWY